jgi:serine/threonine protein kinase
MLPIEPDTLLQQRYRILKLLGEGKFGRTYLAADRGRGDAFCAIEELAAPTQPAAEVAKITELFKKEANLLYQLQHPQIPRFWTTVEDDHRLLLVRDYVLGKTYRDLLNDRRNVGRTFNESEVYQLLLELLPVIAYIHESGTIHRDLAPEHIVCRDGDRLPVPIDFGVVKEFSSRLQAHPGVAQLPIGRSGYAPVEQIQQGQIYPNSDLYALAVTAIVLLTGKEPSALFNDGRINWDWRNWTEIDQGFADVLGRMLSSQPNDRYQSALEVHRDLRALNLPIEHQAESDYEPLDPLSSVVIPPLDDKSRFSVVDRVQTAITNLDVRSIWEKPQVFIPVGVLISLLAGVGSWFGVTQLINQPKPDPEPVATEPPKQIDFNNPTIPTDALPTAVSGDTIVPELDRPIEKEGKVDANTPMRYKITAIAGENLDIQLMPLTARNIDPSKPLPAIDPTVPTTTNPTTTPSNSPSNSPAPIKDRKPKNLPAPVFTPTPTQVLMTIISPTGGPIDDKADRVVGWRGTVPMSGDYTIELLPIKGLPGTFPYKLSVNKISQPATTNPNSPDPATPNPLGGSTTPPPLGVPIPIGGSGMKAIPTVPSPTIPSNDLPTFSPVPIPSASPISPSEAEPPVRRRRRSAESEQPRRARVKREGDQTANEEETPRTRRRRRIVESTEAEVQPRRQRRNRRANPDVQPKIRSAPKPADNPDLDDNVIINAPPIEERVPIVVPEAKKSTPPPAKTDGNNPESKTPPANSNLIDPE